MVDVKSIYSRTFDSTNSNWNDNMDMNRMYLKSQETYFNDRLKVRGYVFLRDVYEALGFPITKASINTGWFYDTTNDFVDNYVHFDMDYNERSIEIDFNVDGDITNHF